MYDEKTAKYASDYKMTEENFYDIYNLDQKMKFIDETCGSSDRELIKDKIRFLNLVGKIETKQNKDLNKFNTVELADLFESLRIVNNSSVANRKNLIKSYFEWSVIQKLIDITAMEQIKNLSTDKINSDEAISQLYFKNYNDLVDGRNTVAKCYKGDINENKIDLFELLTDCAWSGLTLAEATLIKSEDIDTEIGTIDVGGKVFELQENVMLNIIRAGHINIFDDKLVLLNILEKTAISDNVTVDEKDMLSRFSNFKKVLKNVDKNNRFYNHAFTYDKIRKSGIFFRMMRYEKENEFEFSVGSIDELSKIAYLSGLTPQKMNNWIANYHNWRNCFYSY